MPTNDEIGAAGEGADQSRGDSGVRLSLILDNVSDIVFLLGLGPEETYRFEFINPPFLAATGLRAEQVVGRRVEEVIPAPAHGLVLGKYAEAIRERRAAEWEETSAYPSGVRVGEVRVVPIFDGKDRCTHLLGVVHDVTERKALEAERESLLAETERLLEQARARAEREALLNRVGQALRASTDPETIQARAAELLGSALGADRCFYVTYDLARDHAQVSPDWRRDDLPSQAGGYRASDFRAVLGELFPDQRTAAVADVRAALSPSVASAFEATRHRAVLVVPFFEEEALVAALYVSMADAPRAWTAEEVALAEQVATLTRACVAATLVQVREHRVAQQLQDALQPAPPEHVPGLSVGRFTRPALDEAEIGGDFYDIFPLDKELYAVVIGDVSGKGLAAAQQLALVRNSLRTTLYLYRAPARAVDALNAIVTAHDLLVGFVTAWVGVYDASTGRVAYCSCGHEPGLVRRAGGPVEALETTGPPLGVAESAEYHELAVTLSVGDALLLYTDGLSESGPNRRELLGTEGLSRLLAALPTSGAMQAQAEALVGEVSAKAGGVFRDDVAALLARRE